MPVYGCKQGLRLLHKRLRLALETITQDYELVFVDDRSHDGSWDVLRELAAVDPTVRILRLSRNFGQHAAITAGLARSSGRWVIVMDCDLQDPPEDIPRLYTKAQEGYDLVLARRTTSQQSRMRRLSGTTYFRARSFFMRLDVDPHYATLSILKRKVVRAFLDINDVDRQYMLILHWLGFDRAVIDIEPADRAAGKSSYTFRDLVRVAVDGFFFETTILLRWIVYLGFAIAFAGVALAAFFVVSYFVFEPLSGYTSLAVLFLLIGGFIIISTGVAGLYIGKIFGQVKNRPLYVVDEEFAGADLAEAAELGVGERGPEA